MTLRDITKFLKTARGHKLLWCISFLLLIVGVQYLLFIEFHNIAKCIAGASILCLYYGFITPNETHISMKQVGIRIKDMEKNHVQSSALIQIKPFEMDFEDGFQKIIEDYMSNIDKYTHILSCAHPLQGKFDEICDQLYAKCYSDESNDRLIQNEPSKNKFKEEYLQILLRNTASYPSNEIEMQRYNDLFKNENPLAASIIPA